MVIYLLIGLAHATFFVMAVSYNSQMYELQEMANYIILWFVLIMLLYPLFWWIFISITITHGVRRWLR